MNYSEENYKKKIEIRKSREFDMTELLALDEIINDLLKEDSENELYKTISDKINIQVMEWIPF